MTGPAADARSCRCERARLRILMRRSASPFVISNAVRDKWLSAAIHALRRPDRRFRAADGLRHPVRRPRADQPVRCEYPEAGPTRTGAPIRLHGRPHL